jgi:hypothetical protein
MAARSSTASIGSTPPLETMAPAPSPGGPESTNQALQQGLPLEQALAVLGLGWMRQLTESAGPLPWIWQESATTPPGSDGASVDLTTLRQRLELTKLAIDTGAPMSTAEVTLLLGARPGADLVERGGLVARRLRRNLWVLSRGGIRQNDGEQNVVRFSEGFRRRL